MNAALSGGEKTAFGVQRSGTEIECKFLLETSRLRAGEYVQRPGLRNPVAAGMRGGTLWTPHIRSKVPTFPTLKLTLRVEREARNEGSRPTFCWARLENR